MYKGNGQQTQFPLLTESEEYYELTIDRNRIYIFVAFAYAITIALAMVLLFTGGLFLRYPDVVNPLATGLIWLTMFAPTIANLVTRGHGHEGQNRSVLTARLVIP